MWGKMAVAAAALLVAPAVPGAGVAVGLAFTGSASLNAWAGDGCMINDSGAVAVTFGPRGQTFHFRGLLNDVHGTSRAAVWDAATLLPLGFFCRVGELFEVLRVTELEASCETGAFLMRAENKFFHVFELSGGGGCA